MTSTKRKMSITETENALTRKVRLIAYGMFFQSSGMNQ